MAVCPGIEYGDGAGFVERVEVEDGTGEGGFEFLAEAVEQGHRRAEEGFGAKGDFEAEEFGEGVGGDLLGGALILLNPSRLLHLLRRLARRDGSGPCASCRPP